MASSHKFEIALDSYDPWGWRTVKCASCDEIWGETHPEHGDRRRRRISRKCRKGARDGE